MSSSPKEPIFYVGNSPSAKSIKEQSKHIEKIIDAYMYYWGVNIYWGELDVCDVIRAYSRDIYKLQKVDGIAPDPYKQAGYFAFWLRKLKPLFESEINEDGGNILDEEGFQKFNNYLNELFAIFVAYRILRTQLQKQQKKIKKLEDELLANRKFIYDFRYRSFSPYKVATYLYLVVEGGYPNK